MSDQETQIKYGQAVRKLIEQFDAEPVVVDINGTEILVRKPDEYRHVRLLDALDRKLIDEMEYRIAMVQLCVPGDLDRSEALNLLRAEGFPKKDSKILEAISSFGDLFEEMDIKESNEAGKADEATADF